MILQAPFVGRKNFGSFLNAQGLTGTAVEVGTHRGNFAKQLLSTWEGKRLWCVDPYLANYDPDDPASRGDRLADEDEAKRVLAPYNHRVEMLKETNAAAAARFSELDFVYIDACHKYLSVIADLHAWWPTLRSGAMLAGHDFINPWHPSVQKAVLTFAVRRDLYLVVEPDASAWSYYFVKP